MTLNEIAGLVLKQAEEKGWGHTKEMLVVSEKMMLIGTEITEMYDALNKKQVRAKDTQAAECADILMRTLHLGTAWGVDFDTPQIYKKRVWTGSTKHSINSADYLYLFILVSKGYDNYRHKRLTIYKKYLYRIAHEIMELGMSLGVDVKKAVLDKIEINNSRIWKASKLNGNYYQK